MKYYIVFTILLIFISSSENQVIAQFGTQQIISSNSSGSRSIVTGDVDGDGDLDVLVSSAFDDSVRWYINSNGAGDFSQVIDVTNNLDSANSSFPSDLDGDGDLDVLSTSISDNKLVWYENKDGLGAYSNERLIHNNENQSYFAKASDLDSDGDNDVVLISFSGSRILWFENLNGIGLFSSPKIVSSNAPAGSNIDLSDINNDGNVDIIAAIGALDTIGWYENLDGLGNFSALNIVSSTVNGVVSAQAIDIDGDNDLDVLSASVSGDIVWNENLDGLGNFGLDNTINTHAQFPHIAFAADLDNDGDNDVISTHTGEFDSRVFWHENLDGLGNFGPEQIISEQIEFCRFIYADDIDNDGDMDIIYSDQNQDLVAWHENLTILGNQETSATISFTISPNPVKNNITVNTNKAIAKISVYSTIGVLIITQEKLYNIDVSELPSGSYVIKVEDTFGNYGIQKFIKK